MYKIVEILLFVVSNNFCFKCAVGGNANCKTQELYKGTLRTVLLHVMHNESIEKIDTYLLSSEIKELKLFKKKKPTHTHNQTSSVKFTAFQVLRLHHLTNTNMAACWL